MTPSVSQPPQDERTRMLFYMLVRRSLWIIRLRWGVPPTLLLGVFLARRMGFGFHHQGVLWIALGILLYNLVFFAFRRRVRVASAAAVTAFTYLQISLDYAALFGFIHLTGGGSSPVAVFLLFHIILSAILLPTWGAWLAAAVSVSGLIGIEALERASVWAHQEITYLGAPLFLSDEPMLAVLNVAVFATAAFVAAFLGTAIMGVLRKRIVDLAESHETIERISGERDQFMLQVTHNLRSPLTTALSLLETLDGGFLGDLNEKQRAYLQRLRIRMQGLLDTVSELLSLARNKHDVKKIAPRPVSLSSLATKIHQSYLEKATQKGVSFELEAPADPGIWVIGEEGLLEQVLENLVSNAIKYTNQGRVRLTLRREGGELAVVEVQDSGIGIPVKDMGHLFSEFFRARNAKALPVVGTGLGLALVKQTVELLGGDVSVQSEEGKGSLFTIRLPLAASGMRLENV